MALPAITGKKWWPGADQQAKPTSDAQLPKRSEREDRPKPICANPRRSLWQARIDGSRIRC